MQSNKQAVQIIDTPNTKGRPLGSLNKRTVLRQALQQAFDDGEAGFWRAVVTQAKAGRMTRREFVGRTTALGVSAGLASALFTNAARAEEPKKGGVIRVGMQGGESTNSLDPALAASEVPF